MSDAAKSAKFIVRCPNCSKMFRVDPGQVGKKTRCSGCDHPFEIRPIQPPAPAQSPTSDADQLLCPVCQCRVQPEEPTVTCPECEIRYHRECWEYNGGCGVYGCSHVPATEHLDSLEVPASYWGQEEKACPVCNRTILAAALRCRHCGAMFSSAKPQNNATFRARAAFERRRPALRRTATWVLVLGILPCTALPAALFGSIWYARHREEINALPALNNALCKLGVGVAIGQTTLMIVVTLLYGICNG